MVKTTVLHRGILNAYFKFSVTKNAQIVSLPMAIKGYVPSLNKLPIFLHNIAIQISEKKKDQKNIEKGLNYIQVDCDDELNCLYVLAREFGLFYCSCSKGQCELVLKAIRQSKFCVPRYVGSSCYFIVRFPKSGHELNLYTLSQYIINIYSLYFCNKLLFNFLFVQMRMTFIYSPTGQVNVVLYIH